MNKAVFSAVSKTEAGAHRVVLTCVKFSSYCRATIAQLREHEWLAEAPASLSGDERSLSGFSVDEVNSPLNQASSQAGDLFCSKSHSQLSRCTLVLLFCRYK